MSSRLFLLHILILLLLPACTKELSVDNSNLYIGERLPLNMQLQSPLSITDDSNIATVRIIIFNNKGELVYNALTQPQSITPSGITLQMEVARGLNNFYVICNENTELTTKLSLLTRENDLEEITFQASDITPPIPMYEKVKGALVSANRDGTEVKVTINGVTTNSLKIMVDRLMAKVNLTVIKNIQEASSDFTVEDLRIKICRMPQHTPLKPNTPYTSELWTDNLTIAGSGKLSNNGTYNKDDHSLPQDLDNIKFSDIYIPEHILSIPAKQEDATYLLVDAKCRMKNGSSQIIHSIYTIKLGENPPQNHNLTRNNQYDIYATITGMGAMGIYAEIVPMDMYDLPINWKPLEGLVIVSDKTEDYDTTGGVSKNINIWNDYSTYYGILKIYSSTGYKDIHFKYGSLLAIQNNQTAAIQMPFIPPTAANNLGDILWYPATYGNPFVKVFSWGDIPYLSSGNIPVDNSRIAEGLGDPCKLVGLSETQIWDEKIVDNKQWRMATPSDYNILLLATDGESNTEGFKAFHTHLLPNVKIRDNAGVLSAEKNGRGSYWTTEGQQGFGFISNPIGASITTQDPSMGLPIRCVRVNIPLSEMEIKNPNLIGYSGNIATTGTTFNVASNLPYWTAKLIDDPNDPSVGSSRDFGDFSFTGGGTSVHSISGRNTQNIPVFVTRKESQKNRSFSIRVTGIGYDGVQLTRIVTVSQLGYIIGGLAESFSPAMSRPNESEWIAKAGETFTFSIRLTPTDVPIPAGKLQVRVKYHGAEIAQSSLIDTETRKYTYDGFTITIPKNNTPDVIGLDFVIYLENKQIGEELYYQKNK